MYDFLLVIAVVLAVVVPLILVRAYAQVSDEQLAEWARAHGVELTPENQPMVAHYLRKARVLRTWGVLGGLFLPSLMELALSGRLQLLGFGTDGSAAPYAGPIGAFIGYLVGALCAEVSLARPLDSARRSASLVPRRLEDYLPRRLLRAQRGLPIGVVLGLTALAVVPYDPRKTAEPELLALLSGAVLVVGLAAGLEALERWLVRRPQPFTNASLVAADDAIRAQSVHSLAGAGLALLLISCSGVFIGLAASDVAVLRWTMWLPAVVTLLLAVRACLDIGQRAWRVQRPLARPTGAPTA
ncbi:MAG TPA: hypothetical protein VES62_11880 [Thermoleophilaceae bacterium]|nr:hypothetical protein [Thermoleophilaceae bacterium]